jgi:hypothetical protein
MSTFAMLSPCKTYDWCKVDVPNLMFDLTYSPIKLSGVLLGVNLNEKWTPKKTCPKKRLDCVLNFH